MPSDKRPRRRAVSCRSSTGDHSMSPGHGLRVRSSVGFAFVGPVDDEWGRSESLDPDNVGDIADEGMGHRG